MYELGDSTTQPVEEYRLKQNGSGYRFLWRHQDLSPASASGVVCRVVIHAALRNSPWIEFGVRATQDVNGRDLSSRGLRCQATAVPAWNPIQATGFDCGRLRHLDGRPSVDLPSRDCGAKPSGAAKPASPVAPAKSGGCDIGPGSERAGRSIRVKRGRWRRSNRECLSRT
jgi:hypothetical protein